MIMLSWWSWWITDWNRKAGAASQTIWRNHSNSAAFLTVINWKIPPKKMTSYCLNLLFVQRCSCLSAVERTFSRKFVTNDAAWNFMLKASVEDLQPLDVIFALNLSPKRTCVDAPLCISQYKYCSLNRLGECLMWRNNPENLWKH